MTSVSPRERAWIWVSAILLILGALGLGLWWNRRGGDSRVLAEGERAYTSGDWARAADQARRRLRTAPGDNRAVRLLARSTARLGRDAAASGLFARLGAGALEAEDYFLLGGVLQRAGRIQEAERVWRKALTLEPDHAGALDRLVSLYSTRNRLIEAAGVAERLSSRPGFEMKADLSLAVIKAELGDPVAAAASLRRAIGRPEASGWDNPTASRFHRLLGRLLLQTSQPAAAMEVLRKVLESGPDREASWLLSRAALQEGALPEASAALEAAGPYRAEHPLEWEPGLFAGESRCSTCHAEVFRAHQASRHARTLLRGSALAKLPYPEGPSADTDDPSASHQFRKEGSSVVFERKAGDKVRQAVIDYAFGSADHYVSLVGTGDDGRPYIMRLSRYQSGSESGWVRTTGHSAGGEGTSVLLGKPLELADGVYKCLYCHSTEPRAILDNAGPAAGDRAIGCERCHGPAGNHLKAMAVSFADVAIVSAGAVSSEARMGLCGQCHGHHQETGISREDPYWIRFQSTTLSWSRCYTESGGKLDCVTCHDPHRDAALSATDQERRCLACHAREGAAGTRSTESSEAAVAREPGSSLPPVVRPVARSICPVNLSRGCIGCHMPPYRSEPLHATFADHYIRVHRLSGSQTPSK